MPAVDIPVEKYIASSVKKKKVPVKGLWYKSENGRFLHLEQYTDKNIIATTKHRVDLHITCNPKPIVKLTMDFIPLVHWKEELADKYVKLEFKFDKKTTYHTEVLYSPTSLIINEKELLILLREKRKVTIRIKPLVGKYYEGFFYLKHLDFNLKAHCSGS